MQKNSELENFDLAMETILRRPDPKAAKEEMEREKRENQSARHRSDAFPNLSHCELKPVGIIQRNCP
jgi:hypothetical protein